jgi:hypothetical protein
MACDGLALARDSHGPRLSTLIQAQFQLDAQLAKDSEAELLQLGAEQLLQGFRVDIRNDAVGTWHSLCSRQGRYEFTTGGITRNWPADEGVISFHAFNPAPDAPQAQPYAHETWFRWQGWSLAVPRPGKHIGIDGQSTSDADAPTGNLPLKVRFTVPPGSLPKLRFGNPYSCRLRAVDLAGNSLALGDDISDAYTLPLDYFMRFDSLPAPVLLAPAPAGPGESIERLVIHGDGITPSAETAQRLVAPPKTTQIIAEWHGMPLPDWWVATATGPMRQTRFCSAPHCRHYLIYRTLWRNRRASISIPICSWCKSRRHHCNCLSTGVGLT